MAHAKPNAVKGVTSSLYPVATRSSFSPVHTPPQCRANSVRCSKPHFHDWKGDAVYCRSGLVYGREPFPGAQSNLAWVQWRGCYCCCCCM